MGFWEGERCEYCAGPIVEKKSISRKKFEGSMSLNGVLGIPAVHTVM